MVGFTHKRKQIFKKFVKKETIIYGNTINIAHYYYLCKNLAYAQKRLSFLTAIQETTIRLHTSLK